MKKNTKIIVVFIAVILIFTAAFLLWKSSTSPENTEITDPLIIDTLEVSYSKSFGNGMAGCYAATSLRTASANSKYVISATVSELKNTNGSKECYLDVNEVLKGNIEVNQILLRTTEKKPELKEGDEYILFIEHSKQNNTDYYSLMLDGYLIKNGSVYESEGMSPSTHITYKKLKSTLYYIKLLKIENAGYRDESNIFTNLGKNRN